MGSFSSGEPLPGTSDARAPVATIAILGIRLNRFVEFRFALDDDGLLAVELILPLSAFHEFCRAQNATIVAPEDANAAEALERLSWREKQPGLLQRPGILGENA